MMERWIDRAGVLVAEELVGEGRQWDRGAGELRRPVRHGRRWGR